MTNEPQDDQNPPEPTPDPAGETPPRTRALTRYIVLTDATAPENDYYSYDRSPTPVEARTPKAALKAASVDGDRAVAIPESAWHEFRKATTFEEID